MIRHGRIGLWHGRGGLRAALVLLSGLAWGWRTARSQDLDWTRRLPEGQGSSESSDGDGAYGEHRVVGDVAEVVGMVQVVTIPPGETAETSRPLHVGDRVFVGDRLRTGGDGAVELTLGLNARLRLGPDSLLRVRGIRERKASEEAVATERQMELERGAGRVRVRRNRKTPSRLFLISGDAIVFLERADARVAMKKEHRSVMVLDGGAEVLVRRERGGGWSDHESLRLDSLQKVRLRDGEPLPRPESVSKEEALAAQRDLRFSIERARDNLPPPPPTDRELDGP